MPYPPLFDSGSMYANRYDLDKLDVLIDEKYSNISDSKYFEVIGMPSPLTYGKHYGTISVKDPVINNTPFYSNPPPTSGQSEMYMLPGGGGSVDLNQFRLKENSEIKFDVKDSFQNWNPNIQSLADRLLIGPQRELLEKVQRLNNRFGLGLNITRTYRWSPGYKNILHALVLKAMRLDENGKKRAPHLILEAAESN